MDKLLSFYLDKVMTHGKRHKGFMHKDRYIDDAADSKVRMTKKFHKADKRKIVSRDDDVQREIEEYERSGGKVCNGHCRL